ncbi:Uncharacterised protein [Actinomyces bovis]|uniref:HTH tetR-type domain-containing protein n=1 Tax=Actinomyces bovis TaxID=1658 RepID=A0ABY1VN24_9ACTO|nr:TetR/AcrR family transcriptional regulator [Actinomyces bovis]SPT53508.1 Uncharacterised protein [Actinomyces bovis]VEG55428.1 Uncharacterised protein [Actinomyces israelii]
MPRTAQDDPRYQRVRGSLVQAAARLGRERTVDAVAISELTALAGVSRSAFYAHATSPADLLASYLLEKLTPYLDRLGNLLEEEPDNFVTAWRGLYVEVLHTIREDQEIYQHVFGDHGSPAVVGRLRQRFRQTAEEFVQSFITHLEEPVSELWVNMAVSQHVSNTVVIIESWLRTGMREEPGDVVDTFILLAPPWQLVRLSPTGVASLGRRHLLETLAAQGQGTLPGTATPAAPTRNS